jgi:hypothetical protein
VPGSQIWARLDSHMQPNTPLVGAVRSCCEPTALTDTYVGNSWHHQMRAEQDLNKLWPNQYLVIKYILKIYYVENEVKVDIKMKYQVFGDEGRSLQRPDKET